MRVAIVGSRNIGASTKVLNYVNSLPSDSIIVSGGAQGADSYAVHYAERRNLTVKVIRPDWRPNGKYDASAGFKRNLIILDNADRVVAFWDGKSKGTLHTITEAAKRGMEVLINPK